MSKYDFHLDMNSDNSNSVILRNIKPNSFVLEVGCAHGRMTKYLKETLNCDVAIIEQDEEAGNVAKQWACSSFIGEQDGNIENIISRMNGQCDYIIFADVLEHLYDPQKVLLESKKLLKDDGSIWISIPNIAHNAVLIDLWNGKFIYRDVGLLDNTHIRFFTKSSLMQMIEQCALRIDRQFNLVNVVGNTELNNSYQDLPPNLIVEIKGRPEGEVYQFVWELRK